MIRVLVATMIISGHPNPRISVVQLSVMAPEPVTHCLARAPDVVRHENATARIREKYMDMQCRTPDGREIRWRSGPFNRS